MIQPLKQQDLLLFFLIYEIVSSVWVLECCQGCKLLITCIFSLDSANVFSKKRYIKSSWHLFTLEKKKVLFALQNLICLHYPSGLDNMPVNLFFHFSFVVPVLSSCVCCLRLKAMKNCCYIPCICKHAWPISWLGLWKLRKRSWLPDLEKLTHINSDFMQTGWKVHICRAVCP